MRKSIVFILILLSILALLVACKVKVVEYKLALTIVGEGRVRPVPVNTKRGL